MATATPKCLYGGLSSSLPTHHPPTFTTWPYINVHLKKSPQSLENRPSAINIRVAIRKLVDYSENTRWSATASSVSELAACFEMVYLKISIKYMKARLLSDPVTICIINYNNITIIYPRFFSLAWSSSFWKLMHASLNISTEALSSSKDQSNIWFNQCLTTHSKLYSASIKFAHITGQIYWLIPS